MKAAACREQAAADPLNHDYWVDETIKWLELAHAPASQVVVTIDMRPVFRSRHQQRDAGGHENYRSSGGGGEAEPLKQ